MQLAGLEPFNLKEKDIENFGITRHFCREDWICHCREQTPRRSNRKKTFRKLGGKYAIFNEDQDTFPGVLLPVLEESERIFHELVGEGCVSDVRMFLQEHPGFNINCINFQVVVFALR